MKHGDPITIVLENKENAIGSKSRLVHTTVHVWDRRPGDVGDEFMANDDDRVAHRRIDRGVTWLDDHVPFDSPEALTLIGHAELADAERKRQEPFVV